MKRFTIPCDFGGVKAPFHIYVGSGPAPGCHPLKYQEYWLKTERGGVVPPEVVESLAKLDAIATENSVSFEDLCVYALGTAEQPAASGAAARVAPVTEPVAFDPAAPPPDAEGK